MAVKTIAFVLLARALSGEDDDTPARDMFSDDTFGWKSICPEIVVVDVQGGHSSMLQEPFVESIAAELRRKLKHDAEPLRAAVAANLPLERMSA